MSLTLHILFLQPAQKLVLKILDGSQIENVFSTGSQVKLSMRGTFFFNSFKNKINCSFQTVN